MKNKTIYLDYAAATPVDDKVLAAMEPFFSEKFYNPSADYKPSREIHSVIENARKTVAGSLGTKPTEIIFTAGGTEANNLAIIGMAAKFPKCHILATAIEHDSVLEPIRNLRKNGWKTSVVRPKKDGVVDVDSLLQSVTEQTVLISVMYANSEVGTIQPLSKIAAGVQEIRQNRQKTGLDMPLYLHSDACQATNYLGMNVSRLGVDMMSINGGKIYGPKQSGALFVRGGVLLEPLIFGGGQERGLRSGTENVASIVGLAEAAKLTEEMRTQEVARMKKLQAQFCEGIKAINGAHINGSMKKRLPNNIHVTFAGWDNERLLMQLDELGIYAAAGSACSAKKVANSHVLSAMGLSAEQARSSLRFSLGRQTTEDDIRRTVSSLRQLVV